MAGIADGLIEIDHTIQIVLPLLIYEVYFVEDECDRHAVSFSACQEAVDELEGCLGLLDGDNEKTHIHIGGYDVRLLGEVRGLADDVVLAIIQLCDEPLSRLLNICLHFLGDESHLISDCHRIGGADATNAEVALDLAVKDLSRI